MKKEPKEAKSLHDSINSDKSSTKANFDDSFIDYVTCEIDTETINPNDAWQCQPIMLDIEGIETEIRRDYIFDQYVIISPGRGKRPYDTHKNRHPLIETADSPKLDKEKEVYTLKEHGEWVVKVVQNRFPALTMNNIRAHGSQELVIDTPLANTPFARLSLAQIERVLKTYKKRITDLMSKKGIAYVLVFRNDGFEAGASLAHAHSQIYALPIVPKKFLEQSKQIEEYYIDKKKEPIKDIIAYEKSQKKRVIMEDENFISICPYASQYPFEAWIIPKKHVTNFDQLNDGQLKSCAKQLKMLTTKLTGAQISYNFYIENGTSPNFRCIIKLYGRSNIWGGFEVATGMVINTVPPESATKWYRSK
jgi:UDPglucose--hexose-1-phosphate uridylyltransferase